ncbi:esterase [Spirochaetia bacterium]|nr:esterase [Spirochaetia bacterium]
MSKQPKTNKYPIHEDYQNLGVQVQLSPRLLPVIDTLLRLMFDCEKISNTIKITKYKIPASDNGTIDIAVFEPKNVPGELPCLMYIHGGAFVMEAAGYHKQLMGRYAEAARCKIVFVHYRLAPRYVFPVELNDCYTALLWTAKNAEMLGIDSGRIGVAGDSAGGALAAGITQMARDKQGPHLVFQMLVYPVTDARMITESMRTYTDTPVWNSLSNKEMWERYLGADHNTDRTYASPIEGELTGDLPPAYIEVSEFDCLRDEGIAYAEKLTAAGVQVALNQTKGTIHGFELNLKSAYSRAIVADRIVALNGAFHHE